MAKKKVEVPEVEAAVVESPESETTVVEQSNEKNEETEVQSKKENSEEPVAENAEKANEEQPEVATKVEEIPANVQSILKAFNDQPELYVSSNGRVFSPTAKPSLRGNAILYKNPFYNSKQ